jgi:CubicO group peptidase (beta-lactamase class C family)
MTKPMLAVAALTLVEDCVVRLDDPIEEWLPELRDRQVLVDPLGSFDGPTVPAERRITVRDLLTFEMGSGMDFTQPFPQPVMEALDRLDLGAGPPNPQGPPPPDEWIARFATLPLQRQPGERWLYNVAYDVLSVLVARAAGAPLAVVMRDRLFDPLGMADTGFWAPRVGRLTSCYTTDPETGALDLFDPPDGQWSTPPAFPSGAAGLVSTVGDIAAFGQMLLHGGRLPDGGRLLSRPTVEAMTIDQLGVAGGRRGITPDGSDEMGWGFGVGIQLRRTGPGRGVGSYGWDGGLGSSWANDPASGVVAVILTTDAFGGPDAPPSAIRDFFTMVGTSVAD